MIYYIYKTKNLINGKYYIGKRSFKGDNIEKDNYLGSGKLIKMSINKYGKENFNKEIIKICDTLKELNDLEKEIINEDIINDNNSYNLALGGWGGNLGEIVNEKLRIICSSPEYRKKMSEIINSPEVKQKMIFSIKKTMSDLGWKENFSKIQRKVQNTHKNIERNRRNQIIAQSKPHVINKKRNKMNELFSNDEFKKKHLKACQTNNFKEKQRKKVLGKKWVHNINLNQQKYIELNKIDEYINNGWLLGMLKRNHKNT